MSLRHPYASNIGKKCLRKLTRTSVLLTPQALTRDPNTKHKHGGLKRGSLTSPEFYDFLCHLLPET